MADSKIKAVVFDIDGTLSPHVSWTKLTALLGAQVSELNKIYDDLKNGKAEYEESKRAVLRLWESGGKLNKVRLKEIFNNWELKPEAGFVIDYLRSKGYIICLITGSMDLYAEIIAKRLGIVFWYANTVLHWKENGELQDLSYELDADKKKCGQFTEFCSKQSLLPTECVVVGDDANDIGLFELSEHGVAVLSPSSSILDSVAWKRINNLSQLKDIL
ncbi:MAG: HAD-IB family phosphatase [bacterium]|nr:HAD-IB family phosphatase [bacterium]